MVSPLIFIIYYSSSSGVDMPFPTMTICPEFDKKYEAYFTLQKEYDNKPIIKNELTDAEYFDEATKSSSEIIESIEINTLKPKKGGKSKFKYHKNDWLSDWNAKQGFNNKNFGKCYSFSVPDDIKSLEANCLLNSFSKYSTSYTDHNIICIFSDR